MTRKANLERKNQVQQRFAERTPTPTKQGARDPPMKKRRIFLASCRSWSASFDFFVK
jgi:hypothetical protein